MIDGEEWVAADTVASEVTARILQHALSGSPRPRPRQSNGYGAARQAEFGQEQVNPALCQISEELDSEKRALQATLDEIAHTADRLTSLRSHAQTLRETITKLELNRRTLSLLDAKTKAKNIQDMVQRDEDKIHSLQQQIGFLMAHREEAMNELNAVRKTYTSVDGAAAGVSSDRTFYNHTGSVLCYDLKSSHQSGVAKGRGQDTLGQTVSVLEGVAATDHDRHSGPHERVPQSILDIGQHMSASPYVNPADYIVVADRPRANERSGRFADWRSPSRNFTRITQPPGGVSHMSDFFG